MSQKILSQGSTFQVADAGSPTEFLTVGGVSSIRDLRSGTAAEHDVTDLSSTAIEILLGLPDNGTMGVDLFYDPDDAGQIRLENLRESSSIEDFRVTVPNVDGSPSTVTFSFRGFVQTFPVNPQGNAPLTGTVSIRITGPITKS